MNARVPARRDRNDPTRGKQLYRREMRAYITGAILALLLTLVPFAIVRWHVLPREALYYLIGAFALVQMVVHFRFFLHIGLRQKREDLHLILFSTVLLVLIVGGTLWIMFDLAGRMMLPGVR
ncbi:MAG TPA: cytochrome o ubiquinol oxidase subunit IV [Nevskiaceae bacterium]